MKNILLYLIAGVIFWGNINLLSHVWMLDALRVTVLDVGQGLSVLIQYHGTNILVDTGEQPEVVDLLGEYLPFFKKTIDFVVITHSHFDHYGAYHLLQKRYAVQTLVISRLVGNNVMYMNVLRSSSNIPIYTPTTETSILIDDLAITLIQLPPPYNNRNNSSIVTELTYHGNTILITGDLEHDRELELADELSVLPVDYYVAGHHGSNTSSRPAFLDKIRPKLTIISAGEDNTFGHPSPETLTNLLAIKSDILRTDLDGSISIFCKKSKCERKTHDFFDIMNAIMYNKEK